MRKYFTLSLLAIIGFTAINCTDRNNDPIVQDNDTYSQMRDITGTMNTSNNFTITQGIDIGTTDVVLVYRNINSDNNNGVVWQLLPKTEYLSLGRELDYNFLFDTKNVEIFTDANFDRTTFTPAENAQYLSNQRFRIVLVPASSTKNSNLNYEDYQSVIKFYNIPDRK